MDYKKLADLLFPNISSDISMFEKKYPERNVNFVTRFAPSPTGFIHMGSLYTAFISWMFAKKNNGIFYLRIEDTDQKRKIQDGISNIINDLTKFDINIDEGPLNGGLYGPYIQSERKEIYMVFAKYLVSTGNAYPCFCHKEELDEIRKEQEKLKLRTGYMGKWAKCHYLSFDEIKKKIENNEEFVIRLKSNGNFDKKFEFKDLIKGKIMLPENDNDIVLIKSDGLPTYHFAHIIDDYLMHTTHIIRGDEWLSSLPIHYQLFRIFGFKVPKYAHVAPINKKDGTTIRKLSKRYDPECNISYYFEKGIPADVIKLYLATLINSNFENWYINNMNKDISEFNFEFNKMSVSGPIFDLEKLDNLSKTYFSTLKAEKLYEDLLKYYETYNIKIFNLLKENKDYTINILNIERNKKRPRKDLSCYSDFEYLFSYMYDEYYNMIDKKIDLIDNYESILKDFLNVYCISDNEIEWTDKIKQICLKYNYSCSVKEYNENPKKYNGSITDICTLIRFALTYRLETPNLYEIMKVMGEERIKKRILRFIEKTL